MEKLLAERERAAQERFGAAPRHYANWGGTGRPCEAGRYLVIPLYACRDHGVDSLACELEVYDKETLELVSTHQLSWCEGIELRAYCGSTLWRRLGQLVQNLWHQGGTVYISDVCLQEDGTIACQVRAAWNGRGRDRDFREIYMGRSYLDRTAVLTEKEVINLNA